MGPLMDRLVDREAAMPQIFSPSADSIARSVLTAIVVGPFVLTGFAYALMRSPYTTNQGIAAAHRAGGRVLAYSDVCAHLQRLRRTATPVPAKDLAPNLQSKPQPFVTRPCHRSAAPAGV